MFRARVEGGYEGTVVGKIGGRSLRKFGGCRGALRRFWAMGSRGSGRKSG